MKKVIVIFILLITFVIYTSTFNNINSQTSNAYAEYIRFVSANPATGIKNRIRYNTTTNKLLIWESTGAVAPIEIGGFEGTLSSGQFLAPNGTAALPSFSFTSDPDTGIFRSAANTLGFTTNGVEKWLINSSGSFNPVLDNTYDIGNGLVNPRDIYAARYFRFADSLIKNVGGVIHFRNAADTLSTTVSADLYQATTGYQVTAFGAFVGVTGSTRIIFNNGNMKFNNASNVEVLEISNNSIKLVDSGTKPTCDATTRFTIWADAGDTGVADTTEICTKDNADVYAWRTIF